MRNHIAVKFLAVALCAASLLTAVGSALSVLALTEMGLYDKTVEQVREERLRNHGAFLADEVARYYCSETLGGCPQGLLDQYISSGNFYGFDMEHFGYALKDAEGNLLESGGSLSADSGAAASSFPVTGEYWYLVSQAPENVVEPDEEDEILIASDSSEIEVYNAIPREGAAIYGAAFLDGEGQAMYYLYNSDPIGMAFYSRQGDVTYCSLFEEGWTETGTVYHVMLQGTDGDVLYESHSPYGVGELTTDEGGYLTFTEGFADQSTEPTESPAQSEEGTEPVILAVPEDRARSLEPTLSPEPDTAETEAPGTTEPETVPEATEAAAEPKTEDAEASGEELDAEPIPSVDAEPVLIDGKPLSEYEIYSYGYYDPQRGENMVAQCALVSMPALTMELYTQPGALWDDGMYTVLGIVREYRSDLYLILGLSLLVCAVTVVYLCCAAGRKPRCAEVHAGGLNCMPLDLYLAAAAVGVTGIIYLGAEGTAYLIRENVQAGCVLGVAAAYLASLVIVGFCFAFVAQIKTPGGYWWRNSLIGRCLKLCGRFLRWLRTGGVKLLQGAWRLVWGLAAWMVGLCGRCLKGGARLLKRFFRWLGGGIHRGLSLLPLTWQWLVTGGILLIWLLLAVMNRSEGMTLLWGCCALGVVLYGAHCFGTLLEAARRMSKGDLDTKVDDKAMVGCFKDFAGELNDLAGVAVIAAQKQLKSERMKTELITNVSHDIKTPLTSIINYVDLLQKPHTEAEGQQYLEVLDRQSQRLKKLIDDLMEMSKASTGNLTVDISRVNAGEAINQALGEFADKLDKARLTPVFRQPEEEVYMMADGRLVWRVMSNLLGNAVKYALPGTRLYVDLVQVDGKVILSMKNISREELNVSADELLERFVRGDASRNTEGSGLGLNIARSLMELQKGQLQLLVDGDLFKVTLIFPGAV